MTGSAEVGRGVAVAVLTATVVVVVGCAGGEAQSDRDPQRDRQVATTAATLAGTWAWLRCSIAGEPAEGMPCVEADGREDVSGEGVGLLTFDVDGKHVRFEDNRFTRPVEPFAGRYSVEDGRVVVTATAPPCAGTWTWRATIMDRDPGLDELHLVFEDAGCAVPAGTKWKLLRLTGHDWQF